MPWSDCEKKKKVVLVTPSDWRRLILAEHPTFFVSVIIMDLEQWSSSGTGYVYTVLKSSPRLYGPGYMSLE